jgi:hypothetical protein
MWRKFDNNGKRSKKLDTHTTQKVCNSRRRKEIRKNGGKRNTKKWREKGSVQTVEGFAKPSSPGG